MSSGVIRQRLDDRLSRQLQWLIGIRLIVITSILVPTFVFSLSIAVTDPLPVGFILRFSGLCYVVSFFHLFLLYFWRRRFTAQAYLQLFGDLLLITYLVHHSGGLSSMFSMLYLVDIAIASVLLRRQAGLTIAGISWLLYASLLVAHYQGWLPSSLAERDLGSLARLAYQLTAHLVGFYGVAFLTSFLGRDVSRVEQELAETIENLAELEVLHRDVIGSITSGLINTDLEGKVISVNPAGRGILRAAPDELSDHHIFETGILDRSQWLELARSGPFLRDRVRDEVELIRGDEHLWIGYSIAELKDYSGERRGFTIIFQDLTEQRRMQERLRINDRMVAVGELAAGLAHEIGNPLAAISGSVQLLSETAPEEGGQRRLLEIVKVESDRLDRTIKDFLRFARPRPRQDVVFDVARQLEHNIELLRNSQEVGAAHRIELDLEPDHVRLEADPDQISQIFWNLARNAIRAMPEGGTLAVIGRLDVDRYRIRFADDGVGMTDEERANLFHPYQSFFDGGSGIGMAIVYRIVNEHNGQIEVDSAPGRGTTIEVTVPGASRMKSIASERVGDETGADARRERHRPQAADRRVEVP